jgi:hypothetical protein
MVVASNLLHRLDGQRVAPEFVLDLGEEAELQGTGGAERLAGDRRADS